MKFIVHSQIAEDSIRDDLGRSEYSYYFALKAYQLALMELGSVERVRHPETEVDPIFKTCASHGEACVFLSFAPPHKIPLNLECPTVPVIAWGFGNIPDEVWDDNPRNDWRFVLVKFGCAITMSGYAARAITAALGPDFPVRAIAAPIAARAIEPSTGASQKSGSGNVALTIRGAVIDSRAIGLSVNLMGPPQRPPPSQVRPPAKPESRKPLPPPAATSKVASRNIDTVPPISLERPVTEAPPEPEARITVDGIVYTSVFNPVDTHKNWADIVTAFCWAFRDTDDATLILKMVHKDMVAYWSKLVELLFQLSPFKCRVIALHGYLEEPEYEKLISATSYYVNASNCEGSCRPLMEFLASGRPAIAPAHTAMADYIDDNIAFVLHSSPELSPWPHDPRGVFRTTHHRLDWESLLDAFRKSYRLAKDAPENYSAMAIRAQRKMQESYSIPVVRQQLREFFKQSKFDVAAAGEITVSNAAIVASTDLTDQELK